MPHTVQLTSRAGMLIFMFFSWYKVYGPHLSILFGKYEHLLALKSLNHFFIPKDDIPYKIQPGSANYELTFSICGIVDYFNDVAKVLEPNVDRTPREAICYVYDKIAEQEEKLSQILLSFLVSKGPNVKVIGRKDFARDVRVPTISFRVSGRKSSEIVELLDKQHVAVRWGHFYAVRLVEALNFDDGGVVRVSMVHYNTEQEVQKLVACLDKILQ